jgi:hypothetical protein
MPVCVRVQVIAVMLMMLGVAGCDNQNPVAENPVAEDRSNLPAPVDEVEESEELSEPVLPERVARQYLPFDPEWIPESRIPVKPQRSPQMKIWEVSEFDPNGSVTPEQQQAADDFVKRCFDAAIAKGWFDREKGLADGFRTKGSDERHHRNDDYVVDGVQLDPERPEYLMYYPDPEQPGEFALTGLMFLADAPQARGTQFAGPLAIWHYHVYTNARCWARGGLLSTGMFDRNGGCITGGVPIHRSPEMVHVWLIDHPRGPFSTGMTLPQEVLAAGLAKRKESIGF